MTHSPKQGTAWDDIVNHCAALSKKSVYDIRDVHEWRRKTDHAIRQLFQKTGRGSSARLKLGTNDSEAIK